MPEQSLVLMRLLGGAIGLGVVLFAFMRFRAGSLSRFETALRWLIGFGLLAVCLKPNLADFAVSMLAMEQVAHGRLLALLVLSTLLLWTLFLRERGKLFVTSKTLDRFVRVYSQRQGMNECTAQLNGAEVLVVLPALNEAENIGPVLARVPNQVAGMEVRVLVIDDGSDDDTAQVVRDSGHAVISHPMRRGQGAAQRLAYDVAKRIGAEIVVTLDSDGQHLPEEIERLVEPVKADTYDFVIGSRLLGQREEDSKVRLAGIHVYSALINFLIGTKISDCSNGFKAIRVSSLDRIVLNEDQFQAAETIISAARNGLRIGEVPITVLRRQSGESKKGRNFTYGFNFARAVFKSWWR
ncbi:MAG: hypothetical protein ACI8TQ_000381 [Planctomycetota bacterium]|jgi:hypothetical protein